MPRRKLACELTAVAGAINVIIVALTFALSLLVGTDRGAKCNLGFHPIIEVRSNFRFSINKSMNMIGPTPIRRGVYTPVEDEISSARFSESARVFFVLLYRLNLGSWGTVGPLIMIQKQLEKFGRERFEKRPFS